MKIKRWFSVLLGMLLCISLIPTTALAAEVGELWINGEDITKAQNNTVICGNGMAVYNPSESTLTLENADITQANLISRGIDIPKNTKLEIVLHGENTIKTANGFFAGPGSNVTFSGDGNLTITCNYAPFVSNSDVTVDNASLIVSCTNDGALQVDGKFTIQNGAYIETKGLYYGVQAGSISIAAGSELKADSSEAQCNAIHVGNLSISESSVTATAASSEAYPAIFSAGALSIFSSTVNAASAGDVAIFSPENIDIVNSIVDVNGKAGWDGIKANGIAAVSGSWVNTSGSENFGESITNSVLINGTTGSVIGDATVPGDVTISEGMMLDIPEETRLTIPEGVTLTNKGIVNVKGNIVNHATVHCYSHNGGMATCTEKAICDFCGQEYGDLKAHTLTHYEENTATHLTEGNIEYWQCDVCDKYFKDITAANEISKEETVIPKLTEHTADGMGWHSDGTNHWNTCECGEKLNTATHTFKWVIDKEATSTEKGLKHEECTICGYKKAAIEVPATGTGVEEPSEPTNPTESSKPSDTNSPQTGDNSNLMLWITLMGASAAGLGGVLLLQKSRRSKAK